MHLKIFGLFLLLNLLFHKTEGQDSIPAPSILDNNKHFSINGFVRGGAYYDLNRESDKPYFSSGFADLGLKIESELPSVYKAYADVRFRFGSEFNKPVSTTNIREAFVEYEGKRWNISAGQKIVKWGRADFTNPTSKYNPQNLISRSPDREDMDMGNLLATINWFPAEKFSMQAVAVPYYRSSVLIIDPVKLPENTTIEQINGLITDKQMMSYGLRADVHLKGIDMGISWFEGYDPMPGIALSSFYLDFSGPSPMATTKLSVKPYLTRVAGFDFESSLGSFGIRGEAALASPSLSYITNEYIPMKELKWVAGLDWSKENWRITGEYTGKFIPDFIESAMDPILGTEPDYTKLAGYLSTPGFDVNEYVRQQVGAFNRLYNYQLKKFYHSAGVRVEAELLYGKLLPSLFSLYNFTSKDITIVPEIKYKPADGLTIVAGAEIFSGKKGSLYDIVDDFMNTIYVALKVDF
jgi:hypothetical protein